MTRESKLRLLMIYASIHPEKFESDKLSKLMEVSDLLLLYQYLESNKCHLILEFFLFLVKLLTV